MSGRANMREENNQYTSENEMYRKIYWYACFLYPYPSSEKRLHPEVKLAIDPCCVFFP